MIRTLIVDSRLLSREGLKALLATTDDIAVEGEADNGTSALKCIREQQWDIVLLDVSLPGKTGLDVLKQAKNLRPSLPVLMLSIYPESPYALRAIRAGASGYLTMESSPQHFFSAIRKVANGGKYISSWIAERLIDEIGMQSDKEPHDALTDREFEVFRWIAAGKSLTQIGELLFLSVNTVSTYRNRIMKKMNMHNNAQLISYAIKNGLIN